MTSLSLLLCLQSVLAVYVLPNDGLAVDAETNKEMKYQCIWISVAQCINKNYPGSQVAVNDVRAAAKRGIDAARETALDGEKIRGVNDEDCQYDDVNYEALFQVTRDFGIRIAITAVSEFQESDRNPAHVISTIRIDETMVPELHEGMPLCQIVAYGDDHFELFFDTKQPGTIDIREKYTAAGFAPSISGAHAAAAATGSGPYRAASKPTILPAALRAPPPPVRHYSDTHAHTAFNNAASLASKRDAGAKAKENEKELEEAITFMEGNAENSGLDEDATEAFAARMREAAAANGGKLPDDVLSDILAEINEAM